VEERHKALIDARECLMQSFRVPVNNDEDQKD